MTALLLVTGVAVAQAPAASADTLTTQMPSTASAARVARVVAVARSLAGHPYHYGGVGPRAYDCSGSTLTAWRAAGVQLPRTSRDQYLHLTPGAVRLPLSQRRAGDLVFYTSSRGNPHRIYHVAIFVDRDHVLNANRAGLQIKKFYPDAPGVMQTIVRP